MWHDNERRSRRNSARSEQDPEQSARAQNRWLINRQLARERRLAERRYRTINGLPW
ncbi:MAG TPA: hypothetical protein VF282_07955 [Bacillota bacterium]